MNNPDTDNRRRVLVVDDEPGNIRVLAELLEPDYQIHFATSGEQSLRIARSARPDLILLDVVMPGMDGFEVLRQLKSDDDTMHIPVIFVTAMHEVDDEARGFSLGAVDYIAKPVSPPIVRARVRTHLELKAQRDLLEMQASIDGLTGIANRRRFDDALDQHWRSAQRAGQPLSVMLIDVDYFKQFNDCYGHGPGDDCLLRLAQTLSRCFARADELPARYGGEEFGVVMQDCDGEQAQSQVKRLLEAIHQMDIPHQQSPIGRVSASIGAISGVARAELEPDELLARADHLLYRAKEWGRARCVHRDLDSDHTETLVAPGGSMMDETRRAP